ncbi:flagellin [Bacillus cereus]|uniref:flagellin N-terminal helical domain-containing protein n=1 Tax=Bacillus TaxID=1386 RepID=UPI000BF92BDA|nr:flagellin [Bacillus paranthracis]PFN34924.1 flagellin [Bacillus cereus]MDF9508800.1 flagellin [Bacillus paranthracis]MDF9668092.1 flagellin [Bacillus paranthracis]MDG1606929.1 flagellin [Bacillus paranthracis]NMW12169.1 flagellin [Bacillus paranthracis]
MRINTNINSMRTQEYMRQNQAKMSNAMDRLSSGKRINNASDDAAGLAIATRMRARESGLGVAADNTQNGMSLIRTADSALNSVSNILLRMRDIANQSATGTNTKENQNALNKEFTALKGQIDYIAKNTQFNDKTLLNGVGDTQKGNTVIKIQTLDSDAEDKQLDITLGSATTKALGIDTLNIGGTDAITQPDKPANNKSQEVLNVEEAINTFNEAIKEAGNDDGKINTAVQAFKQTFTTNKAGYTDESAQELDTVLKGFNEGDSIDSIKEKIGALAAKTTSAAPAPAPDSSASEKPAALQAITAIDDALEMIANNRAELGATLNRLDFNVNNLKSQQSSMASAASQIEDADMAKEMSEMTKFKILNEAGISMLSQANQTPQMVSKLLQ